MAPISLQSPDASAIQSNHNGGERERQQVRKCLRRPGSKVMGDSSSALNMKVSRRGHCADTFASTRVHLWRERGYCCHGRRFSGRRAAHDAWRRNVLRAWRLRITQRRQAMTNRHRHQYEVARNLRLRERLSCIHAGTSGLDRRLLREDRLPLFLLVQRRRGVTSPVEQVASKNHPAGGAEDRRQLPGSLRGTSKGAGQTPTTL